MGLGLVAELFASGTVKKADYNYFVILNSSVRGPFIPGHSLVPPPLPLPLSDQPFQGILPLQTRINGDIFLEL